jgi:hypothetical protein
MMTVCPSILVVLGRVLLHILNNMLDIVPVRKSKKMMSAKETREENMGVSTEPILGQNLHLLLLGQRYAQHAPRYNDGHPYDLQGHFCKAYIPSYCKITRSRATLSLEILWKQEECHVFLLLFGARWKSFIKDPNLKIGCRDGRRHSSFKQDVSRAMRKRKL